MLSTCSEYFEEIFQRTQCKHPVIVLKDIKSEDLEALLNYMYVGEVNVVQEKLSGLIKAAECLKIKGLAVADEDSKRKESAKSSEKNTAEESSLHGIHVSESPAAKKRKRELSPENVSNDLSNDCSIQNSTDTEKAKNCKITKLSNSSNNSSNNLQNNTKENDAQARQESSFKATSESVDNDDNLHNAVSNIFLSSI